MANERFTDLPTVPNATMADIICAVQGGVSVQETLAQVLALSLSQTILSYPGNPNGFVAGQVYQFCWDTTDTILFICTVTGNAVSAVWTQVSVNGLISPTEGGTGVSNPTAHTIPIAEGASNFNFLGPLTNGQLLIGSTGADPIAANLTAGTGIVVTNTAGGITVSAPGGTGFTWNDVVTNTQALVSNNGYVTDNGASLVTYTLPSTSNFGDIINVVGRSTGGWKIDQNAGQYIIFGVDTTTTGTGGSLASTNQADSVALLCTVANTEWTVYVAPQGNLTVV